MNRAFLRYAAEIFCTLFHSLHTTENETPQWNLKYCAQIIEIYIKKKYVFILSVVDFGVLSDSCFMVHLTLDYVKNNSKIRYFHILSYLILPRLILSSNGLKIIKNTFEEDVIKYFPGLVQSIKNSQPVFCCHLPTIKLEWMTSSILYGTWSVGYLQCKNIEDAKTV